MFHSKRLNNKITFIHESALRIQLEHELKHRLSPEVLRETFLSKNIFAVIFAKNMRYTIDGIE